MDNKDTKWACLICEKEHSSMDECDSCCKDKKDKVMERFYEICNTESDKRYQILKKRIGDIKIGEICIITIGEKQDIFKGNTIGILTEPEKLNPTIEIPVIIINGKASDASRDMLKEALINNNLKVLACPEGLQIGKIVVTNDK